MENKNANESRFASKSPSESKEHDRVDVNNSQLETNPRSPQQLEETSDDMIEVSEDDQVVVHAVRGDAMMFIYQTVHTRQAILEEIRLRAVDTIMKKLCIVDVQAEYATDVLFTKMVENGKMSKETYNKFWELIKPHNNRYYDAYIPYRKVRDETFEKLENVKSIAEIAVAEKNFMKKVKDIIDLERVQFEEFMKDCRAYLKATEHNCPHCSQTLTEPRHEDKVKSE